MIQRARTDANERGPAPMTGSGASSYRRTSGPPCSWKRTAFTSRATSEASPRSSAASDGSELVAVADDDGQQPRRIDVLGRDARDVLLGRARDLGHEGREVVVGQVVERQLRRARAIWSAVSKLRG